MHILERLGGLGVGTLTDRPTVRHTNSDSGKQKVGEGRWSDMQGAAAESQPYANAAVTIGGVYRGMVSMQMRTTSASNQPTAAPEDNV